MTRTAIVTLSSTPAPGNRARASCDRLGVTFVSGQVLYVAGGPRA